MPDTDKPLALVIDDRVAPLADAAGSATRRRADRGREAGLAARKKPLVFARFPNALCGEGEPVGVLANPVSGPSAPPA